MVKLPFILGTLSSKKGINIQHHMIMPTYLPLVKKSVHHYFRTLSTSLFTAVFLSACADGGGAAGDGAVIDFENNPDAVALVEPFVGLYDLPDNWAGFPDNEAFLEIQEPDNSGVALALVHRLSTTENCIEARRETGDVTKDPFEERVVLDDIIELEFAILSLSGNNLSIFLPQDTNDVDDDGDFDESVTLLASRLGFMASDLPADCQ